MLIALLAASSLLLCPGMEVPASEFFALTAKDIDGNEFAFEKLRGSVAVLITNVASE